MFLPQYCEVNLLGMERFEELLVATCLPDVEPRVEAEKMLKEMRETNGLEFHENLAKALRKESPNVARQLAAVLIRCGVSEDAEGSKCDAVLSVLREAASEENPFVRRCLMEASEVFFSR